MTPAISFDCNGNLFAVTGSNAPGEAFTATHSLLRINKLTAAPTVVCSFSATDVIQVGAFASATTFVHFYGTTSPVMETMSTTQANPLHCATT